MTQAQTPSDPRTSPVSSALRAAVNRLSARDDVHVHVRDFGFRPAASVAALPPGLAEVSAEMHGFRFIWDFADACDRSRTPGSAGGRICIPAYLQSGRIRFAHDESTHTFPAGVRFLLADEHVEEGATYAVLDRDAGTDTARYVFARAGEEHDATPIADSFAAYVDAAIEHGFAWYWQVGSTESKAIIERLRATPHCPRAVSEIEVVARQPGPSAELVHLVLAISEPEGVDGGLFDRLCLYLSQAPGSRVETVCPATRLWDYLAPAPDWPKRRLVVQAVSHRQRDDGRDELQVVVPAALVPGLEPGVRYVAAAVTSGPVAAVPLEASPDGATYELDVEAVEPRSASDARLAKIESLIPSHRLRNAAQALDLKPFNRKNEEYLRDIGARLANLDTIDAKTAARLMAAAQKKPATKKGFLDLFGGEVSGGEDLTIRVAALFSEAGLQREHASAEAHGRRHAVGWLVDLGVDPLRAERDLLDFELKAGQGRQATLRVTMREPTGIAIGKRARSKAVPPAFRVFGGAVLYRAVRKP